MTDHLELDWWDVSEDGGPDDDGDPREYWRATVGEWSLDAWPEDGTYSWDVTDLGRSGAYVSGTGQPTLTAAMMTAEARWRGIVRGEAPHGREAH